MPTIKATLWSKFSKAIRQRDANHEGYIDCPGCYRRKPWQETDCGHFIENTERKSDWGGNALWYNPLNFRAQCKQCNTHKSAVAKRVWTADFIRDHGREKYDELVELKNTPKKWEREEVNQIISSIR